MTDDAFPWRKWLAWTSVSLILVVIVYLLVGFFLVPALVKRMLPAYVEAHGNHRKLTLEEVSANPFRLALTLRGVAVRSADGRPLFSAREIYVNYDLAAIFRGVIGLDEVEFDQPQLNLVLAGKGKLNIADLFEGGEASRKSHPVAVTELRVKDARLRFADRTASRPRRFVFDHLNFNLRHFTTVSGGQGRYTLATSTNDGGRLTWKGTLAAAPLRSSGTVSAEDINLPRLWPYAAHLTRLALHSGTLALNARYDVSRIDGKWTAKISNTGVQLAGIALTDTDGRPFLRVGTAALSDLSADSAEQSLTVGGVKLNDVSVNIVRGRDGQFDVQKLFMPTDEDTSGGELAGHPWDVRVDRLEVSAGTLDFADDSVAQPVRLRIADARLRVNHFVNEPGTEFQVAARAQVGQQGTLNVSGVTAFGPWEGSFQVGVSKLALSPLQGYLHRYARLNVLAGALSASGQIQYQTAHPSVPHLRFRGAAQIDNLRTEDGILGDPLLGWTHLAANGMEFDLDPAGLSIEQVDAEQPAARLVIAPDGSVNLGALRVGRREAASHRGLGFPLRIGRIVVRDGTLQFADHSLQPNVDTGVEKINGTVVDLSSDQSSRARVVLDGKAGDASVAIRGTFNLLAPQRSLNGAMTFRKYDLTALSPYAGEFAGYPVKSGTLSMDLDYRLVGGNLFGDNRIVMNKLTLGSPTHSPKAVSAPVRLAVALLQDRNGQINIDMPVSGNINDPQFSYRGLMWKAFTGLLTKVVSSPFALLGSLVGAGTEPLDFISFEPGAASLSLTQREKLDALADGLRRRPALRLSVHGAADSRRDARAVARRQLSDSLRELKAAELRAAGKSVPAGGVRTVSAKEAPALLARLYRKRFGKAPPKGATAATRNALLKSMAADGAALRRLARERADTIKAYLVNRRHVDRTRVVLGAVVVRPGSASKGVRVALSMSAD